MDRQPTLGLTHQEFRGLVGPVGARHEVNAPTIDGSPSPDWSPVIQRSGERGWKWTIGRISGKAETEGHSLTNQLDMYRHSATACIVQSLITRVAFLKHMSSFAQYTVQQDYSHPSWVRCIGERIVRLSLFWLRDNPKLAVISQISGR